MLSKVKNLYIDRFGHEPHSVVRLTGDGSNRVYFRVSSGNDSVIAAVGTSVEENRAFIALSNAFMFSGKDIKLLA